MFNLFKFTDLEVEIFVGTLLSHQLKESFAHLI